ncbi:MAG: hypothetical protein WC100_01740 [Sterolibacterium sp.]
MDENKRYRVSKKNVATGQWHNHGNIGINKWGKLQLGLRMSPELRAALESLGDGEWVNFSLSEDKPREERVAAPPAPDLDDEIPF